MDSAPGKVAFILLVSSLTLICVVGRISAKPMDQQWGPQELAQHFELHPIDNCIFACDRCFKSEALVKCANKCILTEALMDSEWTTTCPYLARQYIGGPAATNPFRH